MRLIKMKSKFVVAIEETVVQDFEIYAEDGYEAIEKAKEKYRSGEFVLEPGNVTFRQMSLNKPEDEESEWIEF